MRGLAGALLVVALAADARAAGHDRRFALLVGNDRGGRDTRALEYAAEDARRLREVLVSLGDVAAEDAMLLLNGSADELVRALGALERRVAEARQRGQRTTLVLYYSGHAKDGALRLGETRLPLDGLKERLARAPADVTIGIFDSCRSGVGVRTKGARKGPAFDVQAAGGEDARGVVFLSSSSADEDAQESDEIRGSYFSHHLASGLRGSADRSGDGRVTLSEAYAYAYARTVADTADSAAGAQHPTFSYDLKGNGDLVLTEVGGRRAALLLPAAAPGGTYYVVKGGFIAGELVKPEGVERRLAVAPGRYWVKRRLPDRLRIGEITVAAGELATVDEARLRDAPFADDPVKGARRGPAWSLSVAATTQSFFDRPTREGLFPPMGMLGVEVQVRDFFRQSWIVAVDMAAGGAKSKLARPDGSVLPFRFGELVAGGSLLAEYPLDEANRLAILLGARVAFMSMNRKFDGTDIPEQKFSTFSPGLVGVMRYRITGGLEAFVRLRLHTLVYNVEANHSLGYGELAAAVTYEF